MADAKNLFMTGNPISQGSGGTITHWIIFLLCQLVFGTGLTILYLGMRGIMRLGGFVASGGPYEIAHPAPGWVWILWPAIFLGLIAVFISFVVRRKIGGPNLMALAWSALFISLGWNFLEFGFSPPVGDGLAWGWIIPGIIFVPMGVIPLFAVFFIMRSHRRSQREATAKLESRGEPIPKKTRWGPSLLLQILAVGLGVYLGIGFFNSQAKPNTIETSPIKEKSAKKSQTSRFSEQGSVLEFEKAGKTLYLIARRDGSWEILFDGDLYERIRDLPTDAQRLFKNSLKNIKGLKK
jgi:hypothetical protein